MLRSKLLIAIFAAAVIGALAALPTGSAQAEQRTLLVTLLGGGTMTVTVDVPPGTPVDQIQPPGVGGVVVPVQDVPPAPAPEPPAPEPIPAAPATTPDPSATTPTTPGGPST